MRIFGEVGGPRSGVRTWRPGISRPDLCRGLAIVVALILTLRAAAGEGRHPDAVTVFHCAFGDDWDVNYDLWPDRWVRKTGLGYPHYVNIAIRDDVPEVLPPEIRTAFGRSFSFTTVPLEA